LNNLEKLKNIKEKSEQFRSTFKVIVDDVVKKGHKNFTIDFLYSEAKRLETTPIDFLVNIAKVYDYDEIANIWAEFYGIEKKTEFNIKKRDDWYVKFETNNNKEEYGVATPISFLQLKEKFPDASIKIISQNILELKDVADEGIKGYFYKLIQDCQELGISDIHFEIKDYGYEIKGRLIGDMIPLDIYPIEKSYALQQIIKNISANYSQIDTEQWNKSQNSRIEIPERKLDLRLAFTPSLIEKFQNLVIRLLSKEQTRIKGKEDVRKLGYLDEDVDVLLRHNELNEGLNIMSGSTGSGKSRSLNSIISLIDKSRSIRTVEDPVEYILENAVQHQTYKIIKENQEESVNMDYLAYVLSFMRQDPDVLLVGEWRKIKELTESLLYASETGHLVFTTLHASRVTNIPNLLVNQYGLVKEDLANNVNILINQKLVKKVCPYCSEKIVVSEYDLKKFEHIKMLDKDKFQKLIGEEVSEANKQGCEKCRVYHPVNKSQVLSAGYSGRTVLYEYMPFELEAKTEILKGTNSIDIEKLLIKMSKEKKAKTLIDVAVQKIKIGEVDLETIASSFAG